MTGRVGFYIGRFQPPHKGHIHAILYALGKVEELIIGIGSAQYSHEPMNPFTTGERFAMLRLALDEAGIDRGRYIIIHIPDTGTHSVWVAHLKSLTPQFDVVFSNDPLTSRLLKESGFIVERIPFLQRDKFNATLVREKILNGENWEDLVPSSVAAFIKKIGGVERVRELTYSDKLDH
ncbi:MAG: nicotinamide-nucleotide adenylyltransferase [Candidatus Bathyarchaeia archaeon]